MTNLVPCPMCGQLHEETPEGIIPCPFMPEDKAVMIGSDSPRGVAILDLGEPVGEKVETPAEKARRLLYGERRAAA